MPANHSITNVLSPNCWLVGSIEDLCRFSGISAISTTWKQEIFNLRNRRGETGNQTTPQGKRLTTPPPLLLHEYMEL